MVTIDKFVKIKSFFDELESNDFYRRTLLSIYYRVMTDPDATTYLILQSDNGVIDIHDTERYVGSYIIEMILDESISAMIVTPSKELQMASMQDRVDFMKKFASHQAGGDLEIANRALSNYISRVSH